MKTLAQHALDPSMLSTFTASLASLSSDEIRKAKSLYIRNAIADYRMMLKSSRGFLVVMGVMSIIPVFLAVFIPAFVSYRAAKKTESKRSRTPCLYGGKIWDMITYSCPARLKMNKARWRGKFQVRGV